MYPKLCILNLYFLSYNLIQVHSWKREKEDPECPECPESPEGPGGPEGGSIETVPAVHRVEPTGTNIWSNKQSALVQSLGHLA